MPVFDAVLIFLGVVVCPLLFYRNHLTCKMRIRALDVIQERSMKYIDDGEYWRLDSIYDAYHRKSYGAQMLDLTKWTFRQFFPEYAE